MTGYQVLKCLIQTNIIDAKVTLSICLFGFYGKMAEPILISLVLGLEQ